MDALLVIAGLAGLGYGGYSALVLPDKPLARGDSRLATRNWATGVLIALAGTLALTIGVADDLGSQIVGFVVLAALVLGGATWQWRRMLDKVGGR